MDKENYYKEVLESWTVPHKCSKEESWDKLNHRIAEQGRREIKVVSINRRMSWVAAAAAVLVAAFFVYEKLDDVTISTLASDHEEVNLPDGSVIWLNSGSTVVFDEGDWDDERLVELDGEAFFEVKEGSDFLVSTDLGRVSVRGTKFNVYAREDFEVDCVEGSVAVVCKEEEVVLNGNMQVEMDATGLADPVSITQWKDWRASEYYYSEEPLERVFEEIEIQFGVDLTFPNVDDRTYSGPLLTSRLDQSLSMVCMPMGMNYAIHDNMDVTISHEATP